jgi:predicted Zn-ribbon and HTH transcriptional regulator
MDAAERVVVDGAADPNTCYKADGVGSRKDQRSVWVCTCRRCGATWTSRGLKKPRSCSKCKSRYWNSPRVRARKKPQGAPES